MALLNELMYWGAIAGRIWKHICKRGGRYGRPQKKRRRRKTGGNILKKC
jgi:hypothetical protein